MDKEFHERPTKAIKAFAKEVNKHFCWYHGSELCIICERHRPMSLDKPESDYFDREYRA